MRIGKHGPQSKEENGVKDAEKKLPDSFPPNGGMHEKTDHFDGDTRDTLASWR